MSKRTQLLAGDDVAAAEPAVRVAVHDALLDDRLERAAHDVPVG